MPILDLRKMTKKDLVKLAKEKGISKASNFWSVKRLVEEISKVPDPEFEKLPPEVQDAVEEVEEAATADIPPEEESPKDPLRIKHYLVTWKGPKEQIRNTPIQSVPALFFQRGVEVDLEIALRAEIGTAHPQRDQIAKEWAETMAAEYRKLASKPGAEFVYKEKLGPLTLTTITGSGVGQVEKLQKVLSMELDEVMGWVRKLRDGDVLPIVKGPEMQTRELTRENDALVTLNWLYRLERESSRGRPMLLDWLYDEAREIQGMKRLKTNLRETQLNPEEVSP